MSATIASKMFSKTIALKTFKESKLGVDFGAGNNAFITSSCLFVRKKMVE
ncbi:MAG: hypothetical protein IJK81_01380 [Selenomonadaceae bacterium]|nr:hypothetical protein [Selenomonadaceae bacterium]